MKYESDNCIYRCISGSRAYGTSRPDSDFDYRSIVIPPKEYWFGLNVFETYVSKTEDIVIYSIKDFFKLAIKNNPNILELLFMPDFTILKKTKWMDKIIEHRDQFLSERIVTTYIGYAQSKLKEIQNRKHIPNSKRKALEDKYGFDTKDACNLYRLLKTGYELLTTGKLEVFRSDREIILDILHGKWSYNEIIQFVDDMKKQINDIHEGKSIIKSVLPKKPNIELLNNLLIEIVEGFFSDQK